MENNNLEISKNVVVCSCSVMLGSPEPHPWFIGPLTFGLQTLHCFQYLFLCTQLHSDSQTLIIHPYLET